MTRLFVFLAERKSRGYKIKRTDEEAIVDGNKFLGGIEERFIAEAKEKIEKEEKVQELEQLFLLGDEASE